MDDKLALLKNSKKELEDNIDNIEEFEKKLGIPVSKTERSLQPYSKKIHFNREEHN